MYHLLYRQASTGTARFPPDGNKERWKIMISFKPFWDTMLRSNETQYTLIKYHRISPGHLNRLRNDLPLSTDTINSLCTILNCEISDIMTFQPSSDLDSD